MSGARDRYDAGKRAPRKPVSTEGLTYEQQRAIDPKVCRLIQDACAVDIISSAFRRAQFDITVAQDTPTCGPLDHAIIDAFLLALRDGSLAGIDVMVSTRRAEMLVALVKRYEELTTPKPSGIGFKRNRKPKRKVAA